VCGCGGGDFGALRVWMDDMKNWRKHILAWLLRDRKDGVAVIIVLGLLALLTVLAVSFAITMRVERAGASNYANMVRARQMVWAGLGEAIGQINETIGTDMYPPGDVLVSGASTWDADTSSGRGIRLLSGSTTSHVPDVYLTNTVTAMQAGWESADTGRGSMRTGQAAYMVLNLSDMLDLHYVGGAPRAGGTNVAELVIHPPPPDGLGIDTNLLVEARTVDGPFETLAEFKALYPEIRTAYLTEYSRYLSDTNRADAFYMGTSLGDIEANKSEILAAVRRILGVRRLLSANEDRWFDYFLDYLEDTLAPRRLDGPNAKPVPLINEVVPADGRRIPELTTTTLSGMINIEVWNPSMTNRPGERFKVVGDINTTVDISNDLGPIGTSPYVYSHSFEGREFTMATNQIRLSGIEIFPRSGMSWPAVDVTTNNPQAVVDVVITNLQVVLASDGTTVDSTADVTFRFSYSNDYVVGAIFADESWQVEDPRLNWHTNAWTLAPATPEDFNAGQAGKRVYTPERGELLTPLELGHLLCLGVRERSDPTGFSEWEPWREFQIYGSTRHTLLEHLKTNDEEVRRGLVNVNTFDPRLLQTASKMLPYPAPDMAPEVADFLLSSSETTTYKQLTDVLGLDWEAEFPDLSDVERESLAIYSTGLMGVRQNLFLIVVAAAASEYGVGSVNESATSGRALLRAVALVWRDPVPNAEGLHDCFVQQFQWLE